jgi:TonB family protein
MLPVHRWFLFGLGALLSCAAWAQAAPAQAELDESKIPEWVKRQARSPYKVIIESNSVKAKPAPAKEDNSTKKAVKKAPARPAASVPAPAAVAADKRSPPALATPVATPASQNAGAAEAPAAEPGADSATPPDPDATINNDTATAAATLSAPAAVAAAAEPPPLTLIKRVEPALTTDLLDSRLNTAKVVVAFTVNPNGEVSNVFVAESSDRRLNRSVLRAVQAWVYAPIPKPREHRVSFAFKME